MKGNKLSFLYNKREEVPLLRGRMYLLNLIIIPVMFYKFTKYNLDKTLTLSYYIHFICYAYHSFSCYIFHDCHNLLARSTYGRLDYSGIFVAIIGGIFPAMVYFLEKDLDVIVIIGVLLINFIGSLVFLNSDLINASRCFKFITMSTTSVGTMYLSYKMAINKLYSSAALLAMCYVITIIGALIWKIGKPNLIKGVFEHHELTHLLYVIAAPISSIVNFTVTSSNK